MRIYLDNAATTPIAPEVVTAMTDVLSNHFGNPSSSHHFGRDTKALIETSRRAVAKELNCHSSEIIFTCGGTEADNAALYLSVRNLGVERIITTSIEHHAVGHTVEALKKEVGTEIVYLDVDGKGNIPLSKLEELLKESKKTLVSLMHANNEIGTLLPIQLVSELCRKYNAYFHSDTVQSMAHYRFDLGALDIDFITCSAHKFHGPKGVGFLYVNKKLKIGSFIHGGAQERGMRGGTENVPGIVGLAKAFQLAYNDIEEHHTHIQGLKSYMIDALKKVIPNVSFHGETDPEKSLYTVLNVCFPRFEGSGMFLFTLDLKGIAVSGGSACSSGAVGASHVLSGIEADLNRPNARFSFSKFNTKEEIERVIEELRLIVK